MAPLALFGINNDAVNLALGLLLLFIGALWFALIWWTYMDARRRIEDGLIVTCAVAASTFFPFIGTIVYLIVRPPEFLDDVRERELEMAAAEARLHQLEGDACPYCDFEVEKSFLRCPSCLRRLKEPCQTCGKPLDPRWKICPYCESEIGGAAAPQRQRQRPAQPASSRPQQPAAARPRQAASATRPATPAGGGGGGSRAAQPAARPAGQPASRPAAQPAGQPSARPPGQPARPAAPRPAPRQGAPGPASRPAAGDDGARSTS